MNDPDNKVARDSSYNPSSTDTPSSTDSLSANANHDDDSVNSDERIEWIKSRRSIGNLEHPAPTRQQIEVAVACAATAPDHKKLRPWRFIITEGAARHELGRALVDAALSKAKREGETLSEKTLIKTETMPLRAPVIITVVTQMKEHKKVPTFEQLLSTGAAVQNLILALKAQGFSTVWRTGLLCNEPEVKAYFDVGPDDYVTAFVYTGTGPNKNPKRKPIDIESLLRFDN